jgi:hypothetical protein
MRLTDDELVSAIEAEETTAINWADGPLAEERAQALDRYNKRPYGNEVDGRSQVVSSDVFDAVESVMPGLCRVFLSGDEVGKFDPQSEEDTQAAEVETQACNWYIFTKNDGFEAIYTALKDALLLANSYVKVWWQTREDVMVERYTGMSDEEVAMLGQDAEVKIVEHSEYPDPQAAQIMAQYGAGMSLEQPPVPMLHDVKVERVRPEEYVALCAVPTDEILVSKTHRETSLLNCDFVQHRREMMVGELRELGYKVPADIGESDDDDLRPEALARERYEEDSLDDDENPYDDSRRRVTLRETWIRLGDNGGKQTLWKVCIVGKTILRKEEADHIPIAAFSPILYPHSHVGTSFFTLVEDIAELKTTITRQYLDNLYLQNNSRSVVDVNRVNIDDLLVSRPGGIVRVDGDPTTAVVPIVAPDVGGAALNALEWLEAIKENRTGVARVNQGTLDPNALNRTATGASLMMSAGQARVELIARCLAGGIRDLFLLVHATALKHSTKPLQMRMNNKFVACNPREWKRRTDFSLSVALGTGAPEQQLAKLQGIGQWLAQGMQIGLVTPANLYEFGREYLKAAGYRSSDKFLTAPQPGQQPPQQPNPMVEVENIKQQSAHALKDKELAFQAQQGGQEAQMKAALEQQRMQNEIAAQNAQAEADMVLAREKMQQEMALEQYKAQLASETRVKEKLIEIAGNVLAASMAPEREDGADAGETEGEDAPQMGAMMEQLTAMVASLAQAANAPRQIIRGPDGRAMGVAPMQQGMQ